MPSFSGIVFLTGMHEVDDSKLIKLIDEMKLCACLRYRKVLSYAQTCGETVRGKNKFKLSGIENNSLEKRL
jgi:hypothetical protein